MILGVYSIYDTAVLSWSAPVYSRNKGEMLRSFSEAVNNLETKIGKYPSDFVLFEIGTFNDENCNFALLNAPVRIGVGIEFKKDYVVPSTE